MLGNCNIDDNLLGLLVSADAFQDDTVLDISGNKIEDRGLAHIATALHGNTIIEKIVLGDICEISESGGASIAVILEAHRSLKHFSLHETNICVSGINHIANVLKKNSTFNVTRVGGRGSYNR